jgi:hypothetical protein
MCFFDIDQRLQNYAPRHFTSLNFWSDIKKGIEKEIDAGGYAVLYCEATILMGLLIKNIA